YRLDDPAHSIPWLAQHNATGLLNAAENVQVWDVSFTSLVPGLITGKRIFTLKRLICNPFGCYTRSMLDELTFRRYADRSIESLKKSLIEAEEGGGFEVEEQNGVLNVVFDEPPAKFVITPNTPVRQIWISALSTSFKLDWSEVAGEFVLPKDSLSLKPLV